MTRDTYIRMTDRARALVSRLPGRERMLRLPTLICGETSEQFGLLLPGKGWGQGIRAADVHDLSRHEDAQSGKDTAEKQCGGGM